MVFKALFMAHAPDAEKSEHRSFIDTGMYKLWTVVVRNQQEAVETCHELVGENQINAILLCPGFTHADVAEIAEVVGPDVGVSVARGDGPSNRIVPAYAKWHGKEEMP